MTHLDTKCTPTAFYYKDSEYRQNMSEKYVRQWIFIKRLYNKCRGGKAEPEKKK